ncbi:MAG: hypothetical protein AAGB10_22415 [Pseudomonadota bacterium]
MLTRKQRLQLPIATPLPDELVRRLKALHSIRDDDIARYKAARERLEIRDERDNG